MAGTDLIENVILFTRLCERPSDELRRAGVKHPKPGAQRVLLADVAVDQQPDFF